MDKNELRTKIKFINMLMEVAIISTLVSKYIIIYLNYIFFEEHKQIIALIHLRY